MTVNTMLNCLVIMRCGYDINQKCNGENLSASTPVSCVSNSADEACTVASKMINCRIFTKQTGQAGTMCHKVMICERLYSRREYYFAIVMDRAKSVSLVGTLYYEAVKIRKIDNGRCFL